MKSRFVFIKSFLFSLIPALFSLNVALADAPTFQEKEQAIRNLLIEYSDDVKLKTGLEPEFILVKSDTVQLLGGHKKADQVVLEVWSGAIQKLDLLALELAVCHEIGHMLGEVTRIDAGDSNGPIAVDGVEGEADYFAGIYFKASISSDVAVFKKAIDSLFRAVYGWVPDPSIAEGEVYNEGNGINVSYPSSACRYLSTKAGFEGKPRPSCWYHPK